MFDNKEKCYIFAADNKNAHTEMALLRRKIADFLAEWKGNPEHMPLIVKGARQIGKTSSILEFAHANYRHVVTINFVLQSQYKAIFNDGYEVESIIRNISLINPQWRFVEGQTLIFFDELQSCPACATALKAFKLHGGYDVICSGSLMGLHYQEIESNSVGHKEDYEMHSMDFEEFLWAKGYGDEYIDSLLNHMTEVAPFSQLELERLFAVFREYMALGGMPAVVNHYVRSGNFSGTLRMQRQLLRDYEEDITKYAYGFDKGKIKAVYNHLPVFLAKENKKYQITHVAPHARNRDYAGTVDWLADAGIANPCYCLDQVSLPLRGNYNPKVFKLYYRDTGLLIASLDDEAQEDLRTNKNWGTYKGAIYENVMADALVKQGYQLYFYRNEKSTLEMDFFVRDRQTLVPVEVKATDGATHSLRRLVSDNDAYPDIAYGIKFGYKNIGFNGSFYTFPYFLAFHLRRFLATR